MSRLLFAGIQIRIHLLFWLVIALSLAAGYFIETITLFGIVLIHEIGHVAMAKELGWKVTEVQLLPFGGVATMEDSPEGEPLDEIVVALAGPFMNLLMILFALLLSGFEIWSKEWSDFFIKSNTLIGLFNLLPIWPLDGGRVLQALFSLGCTYRNAVLYSLLTSSLFASCLFGVGLYKMNINLLSVASYLLFLNAQALFRFPYLFMKFLMRRLTHPPKTEKMNAIMLLPSTTVLEASQKLRKGTYHLFWIPGSAGGMVLEEDLLYALLFENKHQLAISRLLS